MKSLKSPYEVYCCDTHTVAMVMVNTWQYCLVTYMLLILVILVML